MSSIVDIYQANKKINIYMETPEGYVLNGECIMAELECPSVMYEMSGRPVASSIDWDVKLTGLNEAKFIMGTSMAEVIAARFLPREWVCKFCGRGNKVEHYQCQSCGWYRGVIADVVEKMGVWRPK